MAVAIVTLSTAVLVGDVVKADQMGSTMGMFGTIWDSGEAAGPILARFLLLIASFSYQPAFGIATLMVAMAPLFLVAVKDPRLARDSSAKPKDI